MRFEREARTREARIDPRLRQAGWTTIRPFTPGLDLRHLSATAIEEYETATGPADYALVDGGRILGVAEAKKLTVGPGGVLPQAERYARGIDQEPRYQGEFGVPFLYSTNGQIIRFHDVRHPLNLSREVSAFHTPSALRELLGRDLDRELDLLATLPQHPRLRPYQIEANAAIEQAIRERKRRLLVTMATGTGKTLTLINEIYRLMKSGTARRVLFLVDRRALAAQAVQAFASFEAEPGLKFDKIYPVYTEAFHQADLDGETQFNPTKIPPGYLTNPKPGTTFVYVSTIQRLAMQLFGGVGAITIGDEAIDADVEQLNIPIHAFDFMVADECHRGYSAKDLSVWRDTLNHFDSITVGLTATPAAHTTAFFSHPVFRYDYEQAVRDGYLVDFDVVKLRSNVRLHGVFLKEGEQVDEIDPVSGARQLDLLEDERAFDAGEVERRITAPDSNRKILEEIKQYAEAHEREYGRFPKTLIFAVNDLPHTSHADQLVEQARSVFGRGEAFVAKITGRVDRPLQQIREFRNRPQPGIVVTVDLLSTGVDIRDLEFIVFLRPVKSRILFEQMLGRGTRKGDKYPDKSHFVVFDCFDGTLFDYFRATTGMTVEPVTSGTKTTEQLIEEIWQNKDRARNITRLAKRLQRIDKEMSGEAFDLFARFIPDGDIARYAQELSALLTAAFVPTMRVLRDPEFQRLLREYPRKRASFYVAPGVEDTVSSEWLIRDGAGREYRPEDYLSVWSTWVRSHQADTEALQILFTRPSEWSGSALKDLRVALLKTPEHFSETALRRAYKAASHKDLVDIISMVKHAANEASPLFTAAERVDLALQRVTQHTDLTADQRQWLERIRAHLVANLSIEREDFDLLPILADRGGWGRANRAFDGKLESIMHQLNEELVAV